MGRGNPEAAAIRAGYLNLKPHMQYLGWLAESRAWLAGPNLSLADLAAAAQLSVLDYIGDIDWSVNAAAHEWYARVKSRPAFRPLLGDRVSGLTPPPHYADLDF
jgi:glutathione S-transferase